MGTDALLTAKKDARKAVLRTWRTDPVRRLCGRSWIREAPALPTVQATEYMANVYSGSSPDHKSPGQVRQGNVPRNGSGLNTTVVIHRVVERLSSQLGVLRESLEL